MAECQPCVLSNHTGCLGLCFCCPLRSGEQGGPLADVVPPEVLRPSSRFTIPPYTRHGHPTGATTTGAAFPPPTSRARCGGPGLCRQCSADAGRLPGRRPPAEPGSSVPRSGSLHSDVSEQIAHPDLRTPEALADAAVFGLALDEAHAVRLAPTLDDGYTVDVGYVHVLTVHGGPCEPRCPHPDHREPSDAPDT